MNNNNINTQINNLTKMNTEQEIIITLPSRKSTVSRSHPTGKKASSLVKKPEEEKSKTYPRECSPTVETEVDLSFPMGHSSKPKRKNKKKGDCEHTNTINENGNDVCIDCGEVLKTISHEAEWTYYGHNDTHHSSDPSRCQYKKVVDKGISKDLKSLGIRKDVVEIADRLYTIVTKGNITRSRFRQGIMFICVFKAYQHLGIPETPDELQKIFPNIKKKDISSGHTYFMTNIPKDELEKYTQEYITAEHYIPKILEKFNAKQEVIEDVLNIYRFLENKSTYINRSNPQSVSSGLVYYYLKKKNADTTAAKFGKLVGLSEITISKLCNDIEEIFHTEEISI